MQGLEPGRMVVLSPKPSVARAILARVKTVGAIDGDVIKSFSDDKIVIRAASSRL